MNSSFLACVFPKSLSLSFCAGFVKEPDFSHKVRIVLIPFAEVRVILYNGLPDSIISC
jgi:hypothetical protein